MENRLMPNGMLSHYIMDQFPEDYRGWGVDVGASDGISVNTTWEMERLYGWTILSVEPNPMFHDALRKERGWVETCACDSEPRDKMVLKVNMDNPEAFSSLRPILNHEKNKADGNRISWWSVEVPVRTVDQLLEKWQFPRLDVLCIDVEGIELDVLKGCDLNRWKPKVIVTECWNKTGPIDGYLDALGYEKGLRFIENDMFIRRPS